MATESVVDAALVALGSEDRQMQALAVTRLLGVVDAHWSQLDHALDTITHLANTPSFPQHESAALLAARTLFHLGDYPAALQYALSAGTLFDLGYPSIFVNTLVSFAVQQYIAGLPDRSGSGAGGASGQATGPATAGAPSAGRSSVGAPGGRVGDPLPRLVISLFDKALESRNYELAGGIALEARHPEWLTRVLGAAAEADTAPDQPALAQLLTFTTQAVRMLDAPWPVRQPFLDVTLRYWRAHPAPNWPIVLWCLCTLDAAAATADLLTSLVLDEPEEGGRVTGKGGSGLTTIAVAAAAGLDEGARRALGYQLAFLIAESESQDFCARVRKHLPPPETETETAPGPAEAAAPSGVGDDPANWVGLALDRRPRRTRRGRRTRSRRATARNRI